MQCLDLYLNIPERVSSHVQDRGHILIKTMNPNQDCQANLRYFIEVTIKIHKCNIFLLERRKFDV